MQPDLPAPLSTSSLSLGFVPLARLQPPGASVAQVPRQAITGRLAQALGARLILVRAPAGFGKTTAMRQLREQFVGAGLATAWLTLDAADSDAPRLLRSLGCALHLLDADAPSAFSAPPDALALLQALAREDRPFALFLDDFELLQGEAVTALVRQIAEQLPARAHLVIGSRTLPELGLGRLRARGQLLEIDAGLLRFSLAEAEEFFRLRGLPLPREALAQLWRKTEGWAGALWLASLALERHGAPDEFVARFSGSDRAVADYLAEDVLARQPPEVRDFLLRTSILRTLEAPACAALVPQVDGLAMLERLAAAHLFLAPTETGAQSWRYHSLFADFLRAQLAREQPDRLAQLHLAASGWYESQQRPVPAIEHALEGGDPPHALHLLERHAEDLLAQGRMRLLARWFGALPAPLLAGRPLLQAVAVCADTFTHGGWTAQQRLDACQAELATGDAAVQAHLNALRPLLLTMMDRVEEALPVGQAALARLPSCRPFADNMLANAMAHVLSASGQPEAARQWLDAAHRTQGGSLFSRMYTEAMEGVFDLQAGRLRQAAARVRMALAATPRAAPYNPMHGNAWAGVLHAGVLYEGHDTDGADHLLSVYLPLARDVGLPDHLIASYRMRARIAFLRGDVDSAFGLLTELDYLGHARQLPRVSASARLEQARIFVLQGQREAAAEALARADDAPVWARVDRMRFAAHEVEDLRIGRLRWRLHFEPAGPALAADLAALADAAEAQARGHRVLKLRTLQALAEAGAGDAAAACATLREVLGTAAREGFMRLLLDEGALLLPVLQAVQRALQQAPAAQADPVVADHARQLLAALSEGGDGPEGGEGGEASVASAPERPSAAAGLQEPLTRKELRVLALLAAGYSNAAMAEKLFVSDSTVRTHLRHINAKLGARNRTQAVALARQAGMVR